MTKNLIPQDPFIEAFGGEPFPDKTYLADGYVYRDLPRMSPEFFDHFVSLVGEENIVWLTKADYGDTKRGQLLISPAGQQNIIDINNTRKEPALCEDEGCPHHGTEHICNNGE